MNRYTPYEVSEDKLDFHFANSACRSLCFPGEIGGYFAMRSRDSEVREFARESERICGKYCNNFD